jgi:hypothetical protein
MKLKVNRVKRITVWTVIYAALLFPTSGYGKQNTDTATCPSAGLTFLSTKKMKSRVRHTLPIDPPCCAKDLILTGTLILEITIDEEGNPTCAKAVVGNPLIIGSAIHSVSGWKFKPYTEDGQRKSFHGQLAISYRASERDVTFKLTD